MQVIFRALEIENFKSFGKKQTLVFDDLPTGLCFLRGDNEVEPALESNGSGKSSIWDALSWCLYAKTPDGLRGPDLTPWGTKDKTTVTLTLELNDGELFSIRRCANPNSLRINDKDAGSEEVERLVGINYATFTNTILLGQGQSLFFDLGPSDKLSLFSDALDLQRWDDRSAKASDKCRVLEKERDEVDRGLVAARSRLDQIKSLLQDLTPQSEKWQSEKLKRLDRLEADIDEQKKLRESATAKKLAAELAEDGALTEKDAINKSWLVEYDTLFQLRDALSALESARKQKTARLKDLEKDLRELSKSKECPTCGQPIKKANLKSHVDELKTKIAKLEKAIEDIDMDTARDAYQKQDAIIERMRPQMEEKTDIEKRARVEVSMWANRLRDIDIELAMLEREFADLQESKNPHMAQIRKLKRDRESLRKEKRELTTDLDKLDRRIARTKYWVRGFKDVRLFVLQEVLTELQMATNSMLDSVGLEDWKVEYDIEQETKSGGVKRGLSVMIYSPTNSKPVRWESWSGGEGQRLRLVGAMALSEVLLGYAGVAPNLEIFDEPNRGLSPGGIQDLCLFLRERAQALGRQIWYTDQQSTESSLFSAVITVTKTDDRGSRISVA